MRLGEETICALFWYLSHLADRLLQLSASLAPNASLSGLLSKVDWLIAPFNDCFSSSRCC